MAGMKLQSMQKESTLAHRVGQPEGKLVSFLSGQSHTGKGQYTVTRQEASFSRQRSAWVSTVTSLNSVGLKQSSEGNCCYCHRLLPVP